MLTWVDAPGEVSLDHVVSAVRTLLNRHESLRTRYTINDRGEPRQVLSKEGVLSVRVFDAAGRDLSREAHAYSEGFRAARYDLERDWPIRVSVFMVGDRPIGVMVGMSHMASDIRGMQVVREDLTELLHCDDVENSDLRPPGRQPLDQVAIERSAASVRDEQRSLELWRERLQQFPDTMFGTPTESPNEPRFWEGSLQSQAIRLASEVIAMRYGLTVPAVIVTAASYGLARLAGREDCAVTIRALNRLEDEVLDAVGHFTEDMGMVLDLRQRDFAEVAGDALVAAIETYRFGRYDPPRLLDLIDEVNRDLGTDKKIDTAFDCAPLRPATDLELEAGTLSKEDLKALLREQTAASTFRWADKRRHELIKCFVRSWGDELFLLVDTAYIDPRHVEGVLRGIERLLVGLACGEGDAVTLINESGISTLAELGTRPV